MRHCIIDNSTKLCLNVIELNPGEQYVSVNKDHVLAPDHSGEIGWTWNGSSWVLPESLVTDEELINKARVKREQLLRLNVDSINPMRWNEMSQVEKNNWTVYRQQLLDIPQQPGFPRTITWPQKP